MRKWEPQTLPRRVLLIKNFMILRNGKVMVAFKRDNEKMGRKNYHQRSLNKIFHNFKKRKKKQGLIFLITNFAF